MRLARVLVVPVALSFLLGAWGGVRPGWAQQATPPSVILRLVSQSVWNGPNRPLDVSVAATNDGAAPLSSLAIELIIGSPTRSRSEYELSLHRDNVTAQLLAVPFVESGTIQPGETRVLHIRETLDPLTARGESALYPLKIELRSQDVPVAGIRTPMVFLSERPQVPLSLAWTWSLAAPMEIDPQGRFLPGTLERAVAPGGRLRAMAGALLSLGTDPVDVVVSPVLADELRRMAAGYRVHGPGEETRTVAPGTGGAADAARLLAMLGDASRRPETETVALPFGDAILPSLSHAGLISDLPTLSARGRQVVASATGSAPSTAVVRPAMGALDAGSFGELAATGASTLLLDPGQVPTPLGPTGRPLPLVTVVSGRASATAIVPDAGVLAPVTLAQADPRLAARAALGELAATWFEAPGTPGRGTAVLFGERTSLPSGFYGAFAALVKGSPWLEPATASAFIHAIPSAGRQPLPARTYRTPGSSYVGRLFSAREALGQFQRATRDSRRLVGRLRDDLLLAEGALSTADPALGRGFIDSVRQRIDLTYRGVRIVSVPVTLASQNTSIPITFENHSAYPIVAEVRLLTDRRLTFVDTLPVPVLPPGASKLIKFPVHARTTGRIPLKVQLRTSLDPAAATIAETDIVVRSTDYNHVALFLTIGAAVFLLAWWGRRFLPRRKS